eukprot:EG_transcript_3982
MSLTPTAPSSSSPTTASGAAPIGTHRCVPRPASPAVAALLEQPAVEDDVGDKLRQLLATVAVPPCLTPGLGVPGCSSCHQPFSPTVWVELCFCCRRSFCKWCLVTVQCGLQCHACYSQVHRSAIRLSALQITEADARFWVQRRCLLQLQELCDRGEVGAEEAAAWSQMGRYAHNYCHFLAARQGLINEGILSARGTSAQRSVSCAQRSRMSTGGWHLAVASPVAVAPPRPRVNSVPDLPQLEEAEIAAEPPLAMGHAPSSEGPPPLYNSFGFLSQGSCCERDFGASLMEVTDLMNGYPDWDLARVYGVVLKGIPNVVRSQLWQRVTGLDLVLQHRRGAYAALLAQPLDPKTGTAIRMDAQRTMMGHAMFPEGGEGEQSLTRLLSAWVSYQPAIGFCQGMSYMAGLALTQFEEEAAFWLFVLLMLKYRLHRLFDEKLAGFHAVCDVLVQSLPGQVRDVLDRNRVPVSMYASKWLFTLFAAPMQCWGAVLTVWDLFLVSCPRLLLPLRLAIGLHRHYQPHITSAPGIRELMQLFQWEIPKELFHLRDLREIVRHPDFLQPLPGAQPIAQRWAAPSPLAPPDLQRLFDAVPFPSAPASPLRRWLGRLRWLSLNPEPIPAGHPMELPGVDETDSPTSGEAWCRVSVER